MSVSFRCCIIEILNDVIFKSCFKIRYMGKELTLKSTFLDTFLTDSVGVSLNNCLYLFNNFIRSPWPMSYRRISSSVTSSSVLLKFSNNTKKCFLDQCFTSGSSLPKAFSRGPTSFYSQSIVMQSQHLFSNTWNNWLVMMPLKMIYDIIVHCIYTVLHFPEHTYSDAVFVKIICHLCKDIATYLLNHRYKKSNGR